MRRWNIIPPDDEERVNDDDGETLLSEMTAGEADNCKFGVNFCI